MLNNPAPLIYQNMMMNMQKEQQEDKKPAVQRMGLLGPKKSTTDKQPSNIAQPANRVLEYMKAIQAKRQELKDNGNS